MKTIVAMDGTPEYEGAGVRRAFVRVGEDAIEVRSPATVVRHARAEIDRYIALEHLTPLPAMLQRGPVPLVLYLGDGFFPEFPRTGWIAAARCHVKAVSIELALDLLTEIRGELVLRIRAAITARPPGWKALVAAYAHAGQRLRFPVFDFAAEKIFAAVCEEARACG